MRVRDANRNQLRVNLVTFLEVQFGTTLLETEFLVPEELAVPIILGSDFIDEFVKPVDLIPNSWFWSTRRRFCGPSGPTSIRYCLSPPCRRVDLPDRRRRWGRPAGPL